MSVFRHDSSLPQLPIPELEDTCQALQEEIQPLVSEEEWRNSCASLVKFQEEDGPLYQSHLQRYQKALGGNASWLRPFWDDRYLTNRQSLPEHVHFSVQLKAERWGEKALSKLILGIGAFAQRLRHGELPPEQNHDTPLSMDMLQKLFYTRIPQPVKDVLYFPSLYAPLYIAVVCKGHWYTLSLTNQQGELLSVSAIQKGLAEISVQSQPRNPICVSSHTSRSRDTSYSMRQQLLQNPLNRMSLDKIDNALFVVCLDEMVNSSDFMHQVITGNTANRYWEKSLQIISSGGQLGATFEHAGCDASIWLYVLGQVDIWIREELPHLPLQEEKAHISSVHWFLQETLITELTQYQDDFIDFSRKMATSQARLEEFSKEQIKARKCRPDAFVQILFQLTYYQLTGKFGSAYEAVATRSFYQGRTDCTRACSLEVVTFIKAFVGGADNTSLLQDLFRLAESAHSQLLRRSQKGLGAERHMTGLLSMKEMWEPSRPLPEVVETQGYLTLTCNTLSTSSVVAPFVSQFGYPPEVEEGVGLGYGVDDVLHLVITTYPEFSFAPEVFIETLKEQGRALFALLDEIV